MRLNKIDPMTAAPVSANVMIRPISENTRKSRSASMVTAVRLNDCATNFSRFSIVPDDRATDHIVTPATKNMNHMHTLSTSVSLKTDHGST